MDVGKTVGGILIVAATAAIWLWPKGKAPEAAPEPARPIRSMVIQSQTRMPDLTFVGTVKAGESRTLAFKQAGRILRIPPSKSQQVKKGEALAWLDPLDFSNNLAKAEAALERDRASFRRKSDAVKINAISREEMSQAEAQLKQSEAEYALAKRALDDTVLVAPFDCTVADVFADELDMVAAGTKILKVQDLSKVKIDVVYPESTVIKAKRVKQRHEEDACPVRISFDSFPGRSFPAKFVEYVSTADVKTQTYLATYEMDPPEDLMLLPGMSATMTISGDSYWDASAESLASVLVPESAVAVDDSGRHFAWKLAKSAKEGEFEVHRAVIELGSSNGTQVQVLKGLVAGDRIATAGVSLLSEGRKVRLLEK